MPATCCVRNSPDGAAVKLALPVPASEAAVTQRRRLLPRLGPLVPERVLRSAGVRFGVIYAGLFGLSAFALAVFLWWSTAGVLERQTDAAINADSQGLSERYIESGVGTLIETIDQRLAGNVDDDAIYLLTDGGFHRLAGNLERWPPQVAMDDEWSQVDILRAGIHGLARVRQFELLGGFHLLIGRDIEARAQMRRLLTDALIWSAGIALILGVSGAWAVRRLFGMTIADVSATAAAISAGDLTRRVRVTGHGDEFDDLAETINDMLERIARLMDGVRQVSNAIAHDLRTPIARARARLEDAATHARGEADLRAALERAQADLDGVTAVFQALLRIAEIEAGARRSAFAAFDLAPVLLDLVDLYGALAEEKGLALRADISAALPSFGDREMVQQAVANLLDNAVKFSTPGSEVVIRARADGEGTLVEVSDRGPGIPEGDRDHAAERFFRGEAARSTPGSGLGLALVQAVAQLHGGALRLEDNAPGLRAVIDLPTHPTVAAVGEGGAATQAAMGENATPSRFWT